LTYPDTSSIRSGRWLSLGPASQLLGVDPDTLRRWADDGRVPAWTTPGGHRRFDRAVLERLAADRGGRSVRSLSTLGASPARLERVYRRHYANEPTTLPPQAAAAAISSADPEREAYRRDGRQLIARLLAFLDARPGDTRTRARLEDEACAVVDEQAARLARSGASLTEAVSRFVVARQPFLTELAQIGRRRSMDPARLADLYGDASALLDRLLLRFIETHQRVGG
jgi:excisionase family DNA binding protein